jgi:5-formyltetrahydrofolate cyclo-ligase
MPPGSEEFVPSMEEALRYRVKAELRRRMRSVRKAFPAAACAERSARIVRRLGMLEPIARAKNVALFWPIEDRHEVDLRALDAQLRARGARIAYPAVDRETGAMTFRFVSGPDAMREAGFGCLEPLPTEPEAAAGALDAIVVPALAVDSRGHRIGYGAGYYDSALPLHAPPSASIAVAFDFQLIAEVPATGRDVRVGWVVTDARDMWISAALQST